MPNNRNAELLDVVRQLSDRNETDELEQRKEELQALTHTNEEMASQLRILAEQRSKNEMAMQSVLNELDMYKRLAAEHERHGQQRGGDRSATSSPGKAVTASTITQPAPTTSAVIDEYQRRIDELQKAFDAYRQETSKDAATLKTEFQQAQKQISDFRVQHMQAKTQNEFLLGM